MLAWKNICAILPRNLPSRLFIVRQSSALPVLFRKDKLGTHGIARADPPPFQACLLQTSLGPALRLLSEKASRDQKETGVLQDLVESREQPQTQLTVGAKGL